MKRWLVITITIVLFVAILFSGMAVFETVRPQAPTKGFYKDGLYLEYLLEWSGDTMNGPIEGDGTVVLKVVNNKIHLNATLMNFYPSGGTLYREVILNLSGDNVTYNGEKVILPFFYGGGNIVSYYRGNFVNITSRADNLATLQGGIINFQAVYYLYTEQHLGNFNESVSNNSAPATYEYGKNTNLLFFINSPIGWDPVIDILLNLTYPEKMPDGSSFYTPINFGLSLHKTNIDLGPVNYFAVILTFIVIALPVILLVCIPLIIIGIYRVVKERRSKGEQ